MKSRPLIFTRHCRNDVFRRQTFENTFPAKNGRRNRLSQASQDVEIQRLHWRGTKKQNVNSWFGRRISTSYHGWTTNSNVRLRLDVIIQRLDMVKTTCFNVPPWLDVKFHCPSTVSTLNIFVTSMVRL
ncbi:hypothetical protein RND81_05G056800 [Saponaria officinalis]|uniref:Uncharacterized protein n=1 Tax=Saponaria officinalis TaxID=3572 RepID=A0AAW1KVS4_SAPOF